MTDFFALSGWVPRTELLSDAWEYGIDAMQRSILFADILRKRGNNYLAHIRAGKPPVLIFNYKVIVDGREFDERPVNYALVEIKADDQQKIDPKKRPIVVIDPRAGHGPGIGGFKRDSEIGMAVQAGHPTYFILFYPEPIPGQTLADVERAEVIFLEEVAKRHPNADPPTLVGNCQAGWASALIGADRPDLTGPLVIAGAPMSYWSGIEGVNTMRYRGGLLGGVWLTSLLSDLGNGKFDGAHLVAGFEDLNPANTYWKKAYHVFANVDTEEQRYLEFERWWGGFYFMTREEIGFIVEHLFIGDKLQKGDLQLEEGKRIDLRNLDDPVVVFASKGDNITPPQQALNWIIEIYGSVEDIRSQNKVIVYLVHTQIGHLGIFVSSSVARKEHREIIDNIDFIDLLPPGLYEMVIEDQEPNALGRDFKVRFEERSLADISALDDGREDEKIFDVIAEVSHANNAVYETSVGPLVRMWSNEFTAEWMRQLHPLRMSRYLWSDLTPWLWPLKVWAPIVRQERRKVAQENPFLKIEAQISEAISNALDGYRDLRDLAIETSVKLAYGHPWVAPFSGNPKETPHEKRFPGEPDKISPEPSVEVRNQLLETMHEGGLCAGIIRVIAAVAGADHVYDSQEMRDAFDVVSKHEQLKQIPRSAYKRMVIEQSRLLELDWDQAIATLPELLTTADTRRQALKIAEQIAYADGHLDTKEQVVIARIAAALHFTSLSSCPG